MIQVLILKKDYYLIIGLAIYRRIMERHGGISEESKVGKGSTLHNIGEKWEKENRKAF